MNWLVALAVVTVAALTWVGMVPRIRIDDPEAPDLRALITPKSTALLAGVAAACSSVLWLTPPSHCWLWVPYLALGLPLVLVDLRTTFLPQRLHWWAAGAMGIGLIPLAVADWRAAVGAMIGAAAAFLFFYLAWRFSRTLGFGDVRLALLIGAVSGQAGVSPWTTSLLAGTVLGALHGIGHAVWARSHTDRPRHFPFGPALWLGPLVAAVVTATAG
ncbi:MAG: A24 family peptidase [Propionibacteriaceae bacterium]|nr:A24 family peptidase [Propionibacteriaceae bacterium]